MDVYYAYSYATAGWMVLQAVPLITSPTMIMTLLSPEVREASPIEVYFSRQCGMASLVIGLLTVLLTGSVPLTSSFAGAASTNLEDPTAPYALPTLSITAIYHATVAFYSYTMWTETGIFPFGIAMASSASLAAVGLWCILFATSSGHISRKTGADKRTSNFPFKNAKAEERKAL